MALRYFAVLYGAVFLLVGAIGFFDAVLQQPPSAPELAVGAGFGLLFGLFPVNVLHNVVHLLFGVWGVIAFAKWAAARLYARSVAVIYLAFAVMGLIPVLQTTFGLVPLYGHDVWLHALLGGVAAVFGWGKLAQAPTTGSARA